MARIFLSHSSENDAEAIALRDWLIAQGWDDLFLDLDPECGLKAGARWQAALKQAAERCELVIFLVSPAWRASEWCVAEFLLAQNLNKRIIGVIVEPIPLEKLPVEMTSEWQLADLTAGNREHKVTVTVPPGDETRTVAFAEDGLARLRIGLMAAGLDARYFAWPPEHDPGRAPYRGLEPLQAEDAGIFFGRDGPTLNGLDTLRGLRDAAPPRLLVILGASGAGKSSFLRAGLLPRLARERQHFVPLPVIRPERAVLHGEQGLVAALETAFKDAGGPRTRTEIRKAIAAGAPDVIALLKDLAQAAGQQSGDKTGESPRKAPAVILAVDQAEELFGAGGAKEAKTLLELIRTLATADDPALIVVFTIRSDGYERLQTAKGLEGIRQHTLSLPPMPKGAYAEVIKGPARRLDGTTRALKIDDDLVDALLTDIAEGRARDALPLLAFTLERLYREAGADGDLKLAEYEELGRVRGSIEAAVERALQTADNDPKIPRDRDARLALLRRGLIPWLAGIDPDTGAPRRRVARRSEIPDESAPLIGLLVEQRLLSTDVSKDTGVVTIEPVHEALLRQWGLLNGWLDEDFGALTTLEGVKRAALDWAANDHEQDWLNHAGTRLEEAEQFAQRDDLAGDLSAEARAYLKQCRDREEARQRERLKRLEAEREEQERRVKDAEALADANKRAVQRTRIGLIAASILASAAVLLGAWAYKQNISLADANDQLAIAFKRLASGFKLKIAPLPKEFVVSREWFAIPTDAKFSVVALTDQDGTQNASGFLIRATDLNANWRDELLLVTASYNIDETPATDTTKDIYATFPGIDQNIRIPLGPVVFSSENLGVSVVRLKGELPANAAAVAKIRRSQISVIDTGIPDVEKFEIEPGYEMEPGAVGMLAMVGVDMDGFFVAFTALLETSYPKLIFADVASYGSGGAPVFDANTGELVCFVHSTVPDRVPAAVDCVSLASVIKATSQAKALN